MMIKFDATESKMVDCLMTKAALKIKARFSQTPTLPNVDYYKPYFILLHLFVHISSSHSAGSRLSQMLGIASTGRDSGLLSDSKQPQQICLIWEVQTPH